MDWPVGDFLTLFRSVTFGGEMHSVESALVSSGRRAPTSGQVMRASAVLRVAL